MSISTTKLFKGFAWLCLFSGFTMLMLEAFLRFHQALAQHPIRATTWSGVSIAMGTMLLLFGAGVLQYADTRKALENFGYLFPFVTNLVATIRPGGRRATDPPTAPESGQIRDALEKVAAEQGEKG